MRYRLPILVTTALCAAVPLVAGAPAAPDVAPVVQTGLPAEIAVPFKVGESLTYTVSWSGFVSGGTATLTVAGKAPASGGRASYQLIAEGKPTSVLDKLYHVYYKAETLIDTRSLQPRKYSVYSNERGRERVKTTTFLPGNQIDFEMRTATVIHQRGAIAPRSLDPLSSIYVMRAIGLKPGDVIGIPITEGGLAYRMRLQVGRAETIKTAIGTVSALRVTPTITDAAGRPTTTKMMTIWITDDARRLPVRLQASLALGSLTLDLAKVSG